MTERIDWDDRAIDQLRYTREVRQDRDEARHLRLVDERAVVARLYPRSGRLEVAPVDPPLTDYERYERNRALVIALDLDPDEGAQPPPDIAA